MRIEHIREFVAVAEAGSFTAAAERTYVTQPVLSKHVKAVEDEIGARLLVRSTKGLSLTPLGEDAYAAFQQIVAKYDALVEHARAQQRDPAKPLRISMLNLGVDRYIIPIATKLQNKHPEIKITYETEKPRGIVRGLIDGSFDVGFLPASAYDDKGELSYIALRREEIFIALASERARKAKGGAIGPDDLEGSPLICLKDRATSVFMNSLIGNAGYHPRKIVEADELEIAAALVVELDGYFAIPDFMVSRFVTFPGIEIRPMANPAFQEISLAYKTANENRALRLFLAEAQATFPSMESSIASE